ncbi:hypothetical protein QE152_g35651 [Popillia japonica]|uniref:Uncharacterized protein n=1 Tax=Popillia japonica TaxID=7064 RepID=A0AAW1IEX5_POPJA
MDYGKTNSYLFGFKTAPSADPVICGRRSATLIRYLVKDSDLSELSLIIWVQSIIFLFLAKRRRKKKTAHRRIETGFGSVDKRRFHLLSARRIQPKSFVWGTT